MPRQFTLKSLLWLMAGLCGFAAIVGAASTPEDRFAIVGGLLLGCAPLASAIALVVDAGKSPWLTITAWTVACISLAAIGGIAVVAMVQQL